jgi:hypothetical protein
MPDVRFSTVLHSHDAFPRNWEMEWDVLARRLARHDEGDKDGPALICSTFTGPPRGHETLAERWLVALDVELHKPTGNRPPPDPKLIAQYLRVKGLAAVLWTTHSHTPLIPRYRVVLPLDGPLRPLAMGRAVDRKIPHLVAANLQLTGSIDTGKTGAESLFYLPRHATTDMAFWSEVVPGQPIKAEEMLAVARMVTVGVQMKRAQREALRKSAEFSPELKALIDAYNDSHELPDLFAEHGYQRHGGGRWKSRYQSPNSQAATAIFPSADGWYSWSESDAAAGLGHDNGDGGRFGDAFALFCHYEFGNNFRAAINALREKYGKTSN